MEVEAVRARGRPRDDDGPDPGGVITRDDLKVRDVAPQPDTCQHGIVHMLRYGDPESRGG
ncbi:hypothetical protein GCM10025867_20960 [Frondihabitans sucicola]|uniref:Uncharacterized protein n=1 Tax=Frondihabitans sucicola TaxID=1268041 RepID=A0ABM8GN35_9MICO|nr:hypothetical protein GCM10025867_20960 [Frondihabitans sucicola]